MEEKKEKKLYITPYKRDIVSPEFCNKVRARLKLTHRQLSNLKIKKICSINNLLIKDWVADNADGFYIKDNGILIVSKFMPKYLRGDKEETIEAIQNNDSHSEKMKAKLIARYDKDITDFKNWGKKGEYNLNPHSFFYMYRPIWFNRQNCDFDKAPLFKFVSSTNLKVRIKDLVFKDNKDYYEWKFSDFSHAKKIKREERALAIERSKSKKKRLKEKLERENGNSTS